MAQIKSQGIAVAAHTMSRQLLLLAIVLTLGRYASQAGAQEAATNPAELRVGVFHADASPPLGSPVAFAKARKIEDPLSARGIVLLGAGKPIVLCAVDWVGISNGGHDAFRQKLAAGAKTTMDRVTVHALHQHDGIRCDFDVDELLQAQGLGGQWFDSVVAREVMDKTAAAVRASIEDAQPVTHLGVGQAIVEKVASNRRILGPDGKVKLFRMSSYRIEPGILAPLNESALRDGYTLSPLHVEEALAAPEGVIDPVLKMLSFWNGEKPIVCLSYYATHPQSYFGEGDVTAEFVGLARAQRENDTSGLRHIHFNGAGGNVAAGKYNDGTPAARRVLTQRMAAGMRKAWEATKKQSLKATDVAWRVAPVQLPPGKHLNEESLRQTLHDVNATDAERYAAARRFAFLTRMRAGHKIELTCLQLKNNYILHMPGELFVEYQLMAQSMRPKDNVLMAAYGEYATGYIGTKVAYAEGGYETSTRSSNVAPEVEQILTDGMRDLLQVR